MSSGIDYGVDGSSKRGMKKRKKSVDVSSVYFSSFGERIARELKKRKRKKIGD